MPKKPSKQELAYEFRYALSSNLAKAEECLRLNPWLIDHPVYGDSESALHFFATENYREIVDWLLNNGANPNGVDDSDTPLHAAAQLGHSEVVRSLVSAGANVNALDFLEETPLHKASSSGHIEILEHLLDSGADPTIAETCGELPVDMALPRKLARVKEVFERYQKTKNIG